MRTGNHTSGGTAKVPGIQLRKWVRSWVSAAIWRVSRRCEQQTAERLEQSVHFRQRVAVSFQLMHGVSLLTFESGLAPCIHMISESLGTCTSVWSVLSLQLSPGMETERPRMERDHDKAIQSKGYPPLSCVLLESSGRRLRENQIRAGESF